ncbi:hypothetical protein D3C77_629810 [compost metagenome]
MGHERHHRVAAHRHTQQALVVDIATEQGKVGLVVEQPQQRFIGVAGFDLDVNAGVLLTELGDLRQHVHRRIHRQHQRAGLQRA